LCGNIIFNISLHSRLDIILGIILLKHISEMVKFNRRMNWFAERNILIPLVVLCDMTNIQIARELLMLFKFKVYVYELELQVR
ncbi:hypothetical protein L9F63_002334, partial [Diploptera punctata]